MMLKQAQLLLATAMASGWSFVNVSTVFADDSSDVRICGFSADVQFTESAPRDRFTISNTSAGDWQVSGVTLDLSTSAGNLIFDITAQGAGVEVFQPFRTEKGEASLRAQPVVADGDQTITLLFTDFGQGSDYQFSIDVDDQLVDSALGQIRVAGSEIQGGVLTVAIENTDGVDTLLSGVFDDNSTIRFSTDAC